MILQLPSNATKPSPMFPSLRRQGCGKTIRCQVESPPPFSAPDAQKCLTISYLVTSCGLSSDAALCAAKVIRRRNKEKPASVIRLLKDHGFSHAQIDRITRRRPELLVANLEKSLKPKLDFLRGEGFSKKEVADILVSNDGLFHRNLERGLISTYRFLSAALPSRSEVVNALRCRGQCLTVDKEADIKILLENGVSETVIVYLIRRHPHALRLKTEHLEATVKKVIEMGVDPQAKKFATALDVFRYFSEASWLKKLETFQELGWSESEAIETFKIYPKIFWLSNERLRFRVNFVKKSIGWDQAFILKNPAVLTYSLENRIIPRVSILKVLMSKGLIKNKWSNSLFAISDESFFEKYVKNYVTEFPGIIKMYEDTVTLEVN